MARVCSGEIVARVRRMDSIPQAQFPSLSNVSSAKRDAVYHNEFATRYTAKLCEVPPRAVGDELQQKDHAMLHQVAPDNFQLARDVFDGDLHLAVVAAFARETPAELYVDDPSAPRAGLLILRDHRFHLAGTPRGEAFPRAVVALLCQRYGSCTPGAEPFECAIAYTPSAWEDSLPPVLCGYPFGARRASILPPATSRPHPASGHTSGLPIATNRRNTSLRNGAGQPTSARRGDPLGGAIGRRFSGAQVRLLPAARAGACRLVSLRV